MLLTFRFCLGLHLPGGCEGRPGHADRQQGQQDGRQQPDPQGHPVRGGKGSPYPPSPTPPPGHWSHLGGSTQPSTAAVVFRLSLCGNQSPELGGERKEGEISFWRGHFSWNIWFYWLCRNYSTFTMILFLLRQMRQKKKTEMLSNKPHHRHTKAVRRRNRNASLQLICDGMDWEYIVRDIALFLSGEKSNLFAVSPSPKAAAF